jgi:hypothetical protein
MILAQHLQAAGHDRGLGGGQGEEEHHRRGGERHGHRRVGDRHVDHAQAGDREIR